MSARRWNGYVDHHREELLGASARPWGARFRDGPCVDDFRLWVVGEPWQEIIVAPIPSHLEGPGGAAYVIVGGDGAPRAPEDPPWPDEVVYRLAETEVLDVEGEPSILAWYEVR